MYINSPLAKHDMVSLNAVVNPLDPSHPLRHLVGSLLFLQLSSHLDISFKFAVLMLSHFAMHILNLVSILAAISHVTPVL